MKSYYLANEQLSRLQTGVQVGLFRSEIDRDGIGQEVESTDYSRQPISFSDPYKGATQNSNRVVFPPMREAIGIVSHYGIFDSSGMFLYGGQLSPAVLGAYQGLVIEIGALRIEEI